MRCSRRGLLALLIAVDLDHEGVALDGRKIYNVAVTGLPPAPRQPAPMELRAVRHIGIDRSTFTTSVLGGPAITAAWAKSISTLVPKLTAHGCTFAGRANWHVGHETCSACLQVFCDAQDIELAQGWVSMLFAFLLWTSSVSGCG